MKELKPMLFDALKGYNAAKLAKDVVAGIIVAIIALPLSIALAMASGVSPEQGIYTAIIAGFLISFFGGSHVQIAGPTAAFATIVAGIVARDGMDGLVVATVLAGIILILMGVLKLGALIKFIPYTITTGFTAGIAATIFIGQWKDFCGITYAEGVSPIETMEKLEAFFAHIGTINLQAVMVGLISLLIIVAWPYVNKIIPGSIIAVFAGIAMVRGLSLNVKTIGDLYTISNALPTLTVPAVTPQLIRQMLPNAFTIAILAAIESLLSCVVADGMTGEKHRSNTELLAQGIGNIGSALFGGIPATGAIARTAANIKSGGRTPVAGLVHSLSLVLVVVVLMPYAAWIPMPTIAAILFTVAYNMCQWRPFVRLVRTAPKSDISVLVVTFALTVVFDLVIAIEFGMILTCVLFVKRMSDETEVKGWRYADDPENDLRSLNRGIRIYEITGPLFFGMTERIANIYVKDFTDCLIIRMRGVPAIDITALNSFENVYNTCKKNGVTLILSHVNEHPYKMMEKSGFVDMVGKENFCDCIDSAIARAEEIISAK